MSKGNSMLLTTKGVAMVLRGRVLDAEEKRGETLNKRRRGGKRYIYTSQRKRKLTEHVHEKKRRLSRHSSKSDDHKEVGWKRSP